MARHPFLEKIQKAREAAEAKPPAPEQEQAKPTEAMTDAELEEAITEARRALLVAQHAELRGREIARVSPGDSSATQAPLGKAAFAAVLREKQRKKRRTWR
jgi:hypothetical protein